MNRINCQVCRDFFTATISDMVSHLVLVHQNDPGIHIICEVPGCQSTFGRVFSYTSHLRRSHNNIDLKKPVTQLEDAHDDAETFDNFQGNILVNPQNQVVDESEETKRINALYLLKLKETNFLTQTSLDTVVQGTTGIVRRTIQSLKKEVEKKLEAGGVELAEIEGLTDLFDDDHPLSNPMAHVETKHFTKPIFH